VGGFQLMFYGDSILAVNTDKSGWNRPDIQPYSFAPFKTSKDTTILEAADYRIEFGDPGMDTSETFYRMGIKIPSVPVNFKVYKVFPSDSGETKVRSKFAFRELDGSNGVFSATKSKADEIIILNNDDVAGYQFNIDRTKYDTSKTNPAPGDWVMIRMLKPFMHQDVFEFTTKKSQVSSVLAETQMDKIKVVPNPYVVANSWEPKNQYSSGRGPRELHFTHLPAKCTIKIFNLRGHLVATLEHDTPSIEDGTEIWDMLTKDKMDIAYGLYVYHVDAGKTGQKIGKFAVIK
jgi:hypothetical protein